MKTKLILFLFLIVISARANSQHLNLGITFQYFMVKQVKVNSDHIVPTASYNYYNVTDNRWKFFSAGQTILMGTVLQLDMKKFYVAIEPSYDLNTTDYSVEYPLAAGNSEKITFKTVSIQIDIPVYVGYQFISSDFLRYSLFAGGGPVFLNHLQPSVRNETKDPDVNDRYYRYDMKDILYTNRPYWNAMAGLGIHFASLGRLDIRYVRRIGSPGSQYSTVFNSLGIGLTFFLPLHLLKNKIYYEE